MNDWSVRVSDAELELRDDKRYITEELSILNMKTDSGTGGPELEVRLG